jgi:hypothetical protein
VSARTLTFNATRPPEVTVRITQDPPRIHADLDLEGSPRTWGLSRVFLPGVGRGLFEQQLALDLLGMALADLVREGKL